MTNKTFKTAAFRRTSLRDAAYFKRYGLLGAKSSVYIVPLDSAGYSTYAELDGLSCYGPASKRVKR